MLRRFAVVLCLLLVGRASPTLGEEATDFYNVVAPAGADPWVFRHEGRYYATVTTGGDVALLRSPWLSTLGAGERKVVWTPAAGSPIAKQLWAPELHRLDGAWYVYVAADDGDNANHRMYVLENRSADPFEGRFVEKGKIADPNSDRWAIDGTVFEAGGRRYFVWSGWEGSEDVRQNLYIAPMRIPWTLAGPRVEISRPTLAWEQRGAPPAVNEGPQILVRGRRVFLVYSASGSWTDHYALGMLSASLESDLLDPASWKKHEEPVFSSAAGVYGPGHGSFTQSPDGREDWLIYHAARHRGAGWSRLIRAQRFEWTADGVPRFGVPVDPNRPIPLPGGEPSRRRFQAEAATLTPTRGLRIESDPTASQGAKVGAVLALFAGALTLDVVAEKTGPHVFSIRYRNRDKHHGSAVQFLRVNDEPPIEFFCPGGGPSSDWSNAFVTAGLRQGANRIRLGWKTGRAEIDCIDVVPPAQVADEGR